jgi:hypothetical protein
MAKTKKKKNGLEAAGNLFEMAVDNGKAFLSSKKEEDEEEDEEA